MPMHKRSLIKVKLGGIVATSVLKMCMKILSICLLSSLVGLGWAGCELCRKNGGVLNIPSDDTWVCTLFEL